MLVVHAGEARLARTSRRRAAGGAGRRCAVLRPRRPLSRPPRRTGRVPRRGGARALLCARRPDAVSAIPGLRALVISVPEPSLAERRALWRAHAPGADVDGVAARFRLSMAQIAHAADVADRLRARARGTGRLPARPISSTAHAMPRGRAWVSWPDGSSPGPAGTTWFCPRSRSSCCDRWRPSCATATSCSRSGATNGPWRASRALKVLFAGESGTGKTMAAGVIAGELGLDLYRVDLATVVSKYVGETEQNLDRIFAAAESSNAMLLFDEADALFGKRSEVKDAHDRYANIEIAYLLQRMEEYAGVVILATNLRSNIDDAFLRRLDVLSSSRSRSRPTGAGSGADWCPPRRRSPTTSTSTSSPTGSGSPAARSATAPSPPPSSPPTRGPRSACTHLLRASRPGPAEAGPADARSRLRRARHSGGTSRSTLRNRAGRVRAGAAARPTTGHDPERGRQDTSSRYSALHMVRLA